MHITLSLLSFASAAMFIFGPGLCFAQAGTTGAPEAPGPGYKVSGPFTHDKLAVYLIHGPSADGPVPLDRKSVV